MDSSNHPPKMSDIHGSYFGDDMVDDLVGQFGMPDPVAEPEQYAAGVAKNLVENDLEKRAMEPDSHDRNNVLADDSQEGTELSEQTQVFDLRDGFDPQREEGLEPNDPITQALADAAEGDFSSLEALSPEDRQVADMLLTAADDLGQRPTDFNASLNDIHRGHSLPPTNTHNANNPTTRPVDPAA